MLTAFNITIDCANPQALASFWATALGYEQGFSGDGWVFLKDPAGAGIEIAFQQVPEAKTVKNRVHLDLRVTDQTLEEARESVEAIGATTLRLVEDGGDTWYIMQDPEGNEFCLIPADHD